MLRRNGQMATEWVKGHFEVPQAHAGAGVESSETEGERSAAFLPTLRSKSISTQIKMTRYQATEQCKQRQWQK